MATTTTTTHLVQIPTVTAIQLVSSSRIPLASGELTLTSLPSSDKLSTDTLPTNLFLKIDTLTIPLPPTCIAVCTKDNHTYLLATPLSQTDTGFIELTLPSIFPTETAQFAAILQTHNFIKNSLVDDTDDLVYALKKAIGDIAGDVHFSETTHRIANGAVEGSAKIAELSGMVASVVSNATFEAGKWVGEKLGVASEPVKEGEEKSLPREVVDQTIEVTSATAESLGESVVSASASVGDSASKAAEENYGQEAKGLVESARETTGNVGKVAVNAVLGTSVLWQAGEAAVGVAKAGEKKDEKVAEMVDVNI